MTQRARMTIAEVGTSYFLNAQIYFLRVRSFANSQT